ncbi:MAG: HAD family hydrolase [Planctomycetota bacterium]|jgi:HAD superfamily hydrolase (TIGR01509 family)
MLKAIIFDFDGVIADTEPLHFQAFLDVVQPLGADFDYTTYARRYIGFDDRDGFAAIAADYGIEIDNGQIEPLIAQKARRFEQIVADGVQTYPGVIELIQSVSKQLPLAICSGALLSDIEAILPGIGDGRLNECFAHIITAEDVQRSKPDPESYALAAARLGVKPAEALAIEDTPAGLRSAVDAGLKTLALTHTHSANSLGAADRVIDSLQGVDLERLNDWLG